MSVFAPPPQTANPGGLAGQAGAAAQAVGTQLGGKAQATTAQLISAMPQALQGLATPGSSSALALSPTAIGGSAASLGSYGLSTPLSALSSITDASGKTATKGASAGAGALSGLTSSLTSVFGGNAATGLFDAFGLGSDVAGLGGDGAGLGSDGAGLGFDWYGLSLDFAGLGSISGADGVPGLGAAGGLPGLGEAASASVGHAESLGTLSVPPGWAQAHRRSRRCPLSTPTPRRADRAQCRRRPPAAPSPSCPWAAWSGASPTVRFSEPGSAPR